MARGHFYFTLSNPDGLFEVKEDQIVSVLDLEQLKKNTLMNYSNIGVADTEWNLPIKV